MIANIVVYLKNDWRLKTELFMLRISTLKLSICLTSSYPKSNQYPNSLTLLYSLYRTNTHITGKFHLLVENFFLSGSNIIKEQKYLLITLTSLYTHSQEMMNDILSTNHAKGTTCDIIFSLELKTRRAGKNSDTANTY